MSIYDDLKCVSAKSASTLSMAFIIVIAGLGTPVDHAVAQVRPIEIKQNTIQQNTIQQNRMTEVNPTEINPTEINPTDINPTEINPTAINATEINPTAINATGIKPTEISATEIKPTEIKPTEITPLQDDFFVNKDAPANPGNAPAAPAAAPVAGPNLGPILIIGGVAVAGAAALAVGLSGLAGADCGAPPQGFGSAWFVEYAAWCDCENGTATTTNGVQCIR